MEEKKYGKRVITYHLRDWLISRQRYWGPPIPIIYCEKCGTLPVPEKDLPVVLPETDNFRPTGTGKSPLASLDNFVNVACPECGGAARRETDVSDNFLDSAWYFYRYIDPTYKTGPFPTGAVGNWLPVDIYIGGFEHALLHLMYTRFITLVFKEMGLIDFEEPFKKFIDNGHILSEGTKMSKSKGNVINPDKYIADYGADTLRMYLMFLGPLTEGGDFRRDAISGIYRFLQRVWNLTQTFKSAAATPAEKTILAQTIKDVSADLEESIQFNTPIAKLMELLNFLLKQGSANPETIKTFLKLLAPFAPHITEELWQGLRGKGEGVKSIHLEKWPEVDEKSLIKQEIKIPVQVDGKFRGIVVATPSNISQEKVVKEALALESVKRNLGNKKYEIKYVEGKILNFILK